MLYFDTLVLHNFKSFKHANIKFTKGFNCIIGSNGSGKSSICDSLLFALGENSLRRFNVSSFPQLINSGAKPRPEDGVKRAYVKLTLSGDEQYEIMRIIKSNNKIAYRLNGRHATKQEVVDLLRYHHSEINDTNVITQGEIISMLSLNPKERRQLIDVAAGIKEFDDKKEAALKELEKVNEKINEANIMLNERLGFLEELKKEKEDAEKYLEYSSLVKRANYTLLKRKEEALQKDYEKLVVSLKEKSRQIEALETELKSIDAEIEKGTSEKQALLNTLNAGSSEINTASKALEEINKSIAVMEADIRNIDARVIALSESAEELVQEKKSLLEKVAANSAQVKEMELKLGETQKLLEKYEPTELATTDDITAKYDSNQKMLNELSIKKENLTKEQMGYEVKQSELSSMTKVHEQSSAEAVKKLDALKEELEKAKKRLSETEGEKAMIESSIKELSTEEGKLKSRIDELYVQSVNIREQIAVQGNPANRISNALKDSVKGFHGAAYELCTYEDKYSAAISAAAGQRLNYLVVDSIDDASDSISLLKAKGLGRATFIPLKDVVVKAGSELEDRRAIPVIQLVRFDKKYSKAFEYIFSNTYLVDSIETAKAIGIGKYRFVTPGGELIEPAGVVSGGSMREHPAQLEAKLRNINAEKSDLEAKLNALNDKKAKFAKELASIQVEQLNLTASAKAIEKDILELGEKLDYARSELAKARSEMAELNNKIATTKNELENLNNEYEKIKGENDRLYGALAAGQKGKIKSAEATKVKELRGSIEKLKIDIATATKENQMMNGRISEIEKSISSIASEQKDLKVRKAENEENKRKLSADVAELQKKIKSHDEKSASIYKKIDEISAAIAQKAQARGRKAGDLDRLKRDIIVIESNMAQTETKLSDIKAELAGYADVQEIDKGNDELEKQLIIWKAEIEKLGNVNMKAPELYEQKSRDVEDARQKVSVLGSEKDSILAMINEIDSKKLSIFMETFKEVNENFKSLFPLAFEGSAYLELENQKDPFNSGLVIKVRTKSNKEKMQETMSGGEKSLLMLMMIFAILMRKPMSFYIFDEIDVSLDKENTKKLSHVIKELSKKSQMVIVSHNDNMIVAADAAIGVSKSNEESKAFGLDIATLQAKTSAPEQNNGQTGN
ncbi:MAG: AAA family ATPase [Candidatus Micrarchaeia archaeon]